MAHGTTSKALDTVLGRLKGVKPFNDGWKAICPAHKDLQASLKIDLKDDGKVLLHCYAGCSTAEIVAELGLRLTDLFPPKDETSSKNGQTAHKVKETRYEGYHAISGDLVGYHIRVDFDDGTKKMWWQKPDGTNSLGGFPLSDMALYGIYQIKNKSAIVITEGEKARDALAAMNIAAVGTMTGASGCPCDDALKPIVGRLIVLWPDQDDPGEKHMARVARALLELGQPPDQIQRVQWADAPPKGDAADFTGTIDDIRELLAAAKPWPFDGDGGGSAPPPPGDPPTAVDDAVAINLTDLGNARRLVRDHGADIRYCHTWKSWLVWNQRWLLDATNEIERRAKRTVAAIYAEAALSDDGKERSAIVKHGLKSEADARIHAMMSLAQSEPGVPVLIEDLDCDPWLLTVANGTLDLRTGELRPHNRVDLITKMVATSYDPDAECPLWHAFLRQVTGGNEQLISFLQRAAGYSLTGDTSERIMFILYGVGKNGKSTFLEVLKTILGDYARSTPAETLMAQKHDVIPHDIARLVGVRFVTASEADDERRFAEAKIKQLTGGDTISARKLYADLFDFIPAFKIWLSTNHKPVVRGTDEAIWDRLKLVPFNVRIPEGDQDKRLRAKLLAEAPGILAWMVQGCLAWQQDGLTEPEEVKEATSDYRSEMDLLGRFFEEHCFFSPGSTATAKALFATYLAWCGLNSEKPMSQTWFGRRLGERGFRRDKKEHGIFWVGIGLISGDDE